MTDRTFQTEFPDFAVADMPALPAGFIDHSWGNDWMPFFIHEELGIGLWIDFADPSKREMENLPRFQIEQMDVSENGWQHGDHEAVLVTDDFAEVEAFVASLAAHPKFATKIETLDQAKAFVERLDADGDMFHFEDSPEEIVMGTHGIAAFTPAECVLLRLRVAELYAQDWSVVGHECPIGYALEVMDRKEAN